MKDKEKKPILSIWDRGNRGFEEQCDAAIEDGYLLWDMYYIPETKDSGSGYGALFILPSVKLVKKLGIQK